METDDVQRTAKLDIKMWNAVAVSKDFFESVQFAICCGQTVQYKQEWIILQ